MAQEEQDTESSTTDNAFFWVFTALAAIWLLLTLIFCNKIRLAIALTEVTSKYIHKTLNKEKNIMLKILMLRI